MQAPSESNLPAFTAETRKALAAAGLAPRMTEQAKLLASVKELYTKGKRWAVWDTDPAGSRNGADPTRIHRLPSIHNDSALHERQHEAWDARAQNFYTQLIETEERSIRRYEANARFRRVLAQRAQQKKRFAPVALGKPGTRYMRDPPERFKQQQRHTDFLKKGAAVFSGSYVSPISLQTSSYMVTCSLCKDNAHHCDHHHSYQHGHAQMHAHPHDFNHAWERPSETYAADDTAIVMETSHRPSQPHTSRTLSQTTPLSPSHTTTWSQPTTYRRTSQPAHLQASIARGSLLHVHVPPHKKK